MDGWMDGWMDGRSDITRYPCCIIVLLVLFNKMRVHSCDTVLCWFLVSSLAPLIADNDPRKSRHHHRINRSRSDITRYPCCIIMLLVLFNKIRVHSYDTVLCWFLVSSLAPLIADNDPVNVGVGGSLRYGRVRLGLGLTVDDRRLWLHGRQQVGVRVTSIRQGLGLHSRQQVRVSSIRQGRSTAARGAHATHKAVRMRNKPETEVTYACGHRI